MRPETPVHDEFLRCITDYIRMFMSMSSISRSQLRQGINRVLKSVKRHNKLCGTRGYLDFIRGPRTVNMKVLIADDTLYRHNRSK